MHYGMMLAAIDVTGRVFLHSNCTLFKKCSEFEVVTEQNGQIVKYLQFNDLGGGRGSLTIEVECRFLVGAAGLGRGCGRLDGV